MFRNRIEAGQKLAEKLKAYHQKPNSIVLALPRGGVVVGREVAHNLNLPLDIVVPRKIGHPTNPEYAIGAITETGEGIWNEEERIQINTDWLKTKISKEQKEAQRRLKAYRGDRPPLDLREKIVIIVDDGIATGLTMRAAIASVRAQKSTKIIVAVPVSARDSAEVIRREVDELVVLEAPPFFGAIGAFYSDFQQVGDDEVIKLLEGKNEKNREK